MTTQDMIDNFLLQYDLNGSGAVAGFTDEEIIEFLNKSQLDIVKKGFLESGPELFHILIDYHGFVMVSTLPEFNMPTTYQSFDSIPPDYMFYISSHTHVSRTAFPLILTGDWIENRRIKMKDLYKFRPNESDKIVFYNPVVEIVSNNITITVDAYSLIVGDQDKDASCTMNYLREPTQISSLVDCELDTKWHQEIVDSALMNAMLVVNDARIRGVKQSKEG